MAGWPGVWARGTAAPVRSGAAPRSADADSACTAGLPARNGLHAVLVDVLLCCAVAVATKHSLCAVPCHAALCCATCLWTTCWAQASTCMCRAVPCCDLSVHAVLCHRSVDNALGAGVNTYVITARACARALAEQRAREHARRVVGGAAGGSAVASVLEGWHAAAQVGPGWVCRGERMGYGRWMGHPGGWGGALSARAAPPGIAQQTHRWPPFLLQPWLFSRCPPTVQPALPAS